MTSAQLTLGIIALIFLIIWLARNGLSIVDAIVIVSFTIFLYWFLTNGYLGLI